MKIAWIGTGVMGRPMATHLIDAGYAVNVFNRTHQKAYQMEPAAKAFDSIEACIKDCDVIFTIVGYPKDVEETYEVIMQHAKKDAILIDMTTSSPSLAIQLYQKSQSLGLHFLDAPVTGGDIGAIQATLSIMVGGEEEIFHQVLPLFKKMGKTITYMGVAGSGMHAKLANQTAIAGAIAGLSEALVYAQDKNLDLNRMLSVITGGSGNSWQAQNNGPKMIHQDYAPGFYVKHFLKDLNLILEEKKDLPLEVVAIVAKAYTDLSKLGFEDQGTQSLIEFYKKNN